MPNLTKINYSELNSRQQENYNFQKVAGYLADYGFNCLKLSDDWQGADFLAIHVDGELFLKVQLKGRLTLNQKYSGKNIHIAFLDGQDCYLYPHDELRDLILSSNKVAHTKSWIECEAYDWPTIPEWAKKILENYKL